MKKISGLIVVVTLIVVVFLGVGCKMIPSDNHDAIEKVDTEQEASKNLEEPVEEPIAEEEYIEVWELTQEKKAAEENSSNQEVKDDSKPEITPEEDSNNSGKEKEETKSEATEEKTEESEVVAPPDENKTEFEKYMAMSGEEQQKIFESYENPQDFFNWYNAAKAEYEENNQAIIVEGGSINLEDYMNNND